MKIGRLGIFWAALVAVAVAFAIFGGVPAHTLLWLIPPLGIMVGITIFTFATPQWQRRIAAPLRWLRARPILYWLLLLVVIGGGLALWVILYQPTNGRWLRAEECCLLLMLLWLLIFLLVYGADREQIRAMGAKLSKSRLSGMMISLTLLLIIFILAETALRLFYVTTDAYTFTAMNYHWYENFYYPTLNTLGYRDHEPTPPNPDHPLIRVGVLGDSFTVGQGVNNVDDTFPQLLERELGANYDVNVIAKSGWDSDVHLVYLQEYPYRPDIVVLSYYLNDIDWLLADTEFNPDANFSFPQNPALAWFVRTFFVPSYVYYNLMQYTSAGRAENFANDLVAAHMEDVIWAQQAEMLGNIAWWTRENNIRLIVLIWPQLAAIDASLPATTRVKEFFQSQGVEVVDLSDPLRQYSTSELIVNNFDTHPGVVAQRVAAQALYPVIISGSQD